MASGALAPCAGCGAYLRKALSTRAGRLPTPFTEPRAASTKAESPLLLPSLPLVVGLWAARHFAASADAAREGPGRSRKGRRASRRTSPT